MKRFWMAACGGLALLAMSVPVRADDARFTIATGAEADSIDLTASIFPPLAYVIMRNVEEALWDYDDNGKVRATVADWERAPDGKTITFKIHPGVKFQSGDELTAADVVFGQQRLVAKTPSFMRHGRLVDNIEAVDKYTVKVTFKTPDNTYFDGVSLFPASKAYFDRVGEKEFSQHPVGIGAYSLVEYKAGQYIDMKAFPDYYGKQPAVKNVRFLFVKDNETRVAKLRAGEVDMIMDTPFPQVGALAKDGFNVVKQPANPTVSVEFDLLNEHAPWHERKVREAIAHAIDADAIISGLFGGVPAHHARLAPGEAGYDPALKPYSYDPTLAKKLLTEAGYPNGFKMPLYYPGGNFYGFRETTEAVTLYLKAVGIECEVHDMEGPKGFEFAKKVQNDPSIDYVSITAMPIANSGLPSIEALTLSFYSKSPYVMYKYPELDAQIPAALAEPDDAKRAELVRQMNQFLYDDVASITLWDGMSVFASKPNVHYTPIANRMPFVTLRNVTVN